MPKGVFKREDKHKDIVGERFGRLVVTNYYRRSGYKMVTVKCDCGIVKESRLSSLIDGYTVSCGCYAKEIARERMLTHGLSTHPLYDRYMGMLNRCYEPTRKDYRHYGGRGIRVCDRWLEPYAKGLNNFIEDMAEGFNKNLELERSDVNGNYCPENCCWVTRSKQVINRRKMGNSFDAHFVKHGGRTLCIAEWADEIGIPATMLADRLTKLQWTVEKALTTPPKFREMYVEIQGEQLKIDKVFKFPPNLYPAAKALGVTTAQYISNIFYEMGVVRGVLCKEVVEIKPTKDWSDKILKVKLTKEVLAKLNISY